MPDHPSDGAESPSSRLRRRASVSPAVLGLLLVSATVSMGLAFEAYRVERSHRRVAETTLQDYATIAAWEFARRAREELQAGVQSVFRPVHTGTGDPSAAELAPPTLLTDADEKAAGCGCPVADSTSLYFRLELPDQVLTTACGIGPEPVRSLMTDSLRAHAAAAYRAQWDWASVYFATPEEPTVVTYTVAGRGAPGSGTLYGFQAPANAFGGPVFRRILDQAPLLPQSLTAGAPNDSLLAVAVVAGSDTLFRSPVRYASLYTAVDTLGERFGGLGVVVTLHPAASARLVAGGVPRSRLPMWIGVLALTLLLAGVSVRQLRRERELLQMRERFLSSVSHELRTPLSQIRISAETLQLGRIGSPAEQERTLEIISRQTRSMTRLVENILQLARGEARAPALSPEPVAVAPEIRAIVESFAPLLATRRVEARLELEDAAVATVDREALNQIVLNLLDNALKYGPEGQTIAVGVARDGDTIRIWIDDEGPGVPPAERARIFEPFVRLRSTSAQPRGCGIGLAVVRELVMLHDGRVYADSAPGGGARFVVELARTQHTLHGIDLAGQRGDPVHPPAEQGAA